MLPKKQKVIQSSIPFKKVGIIGGGTAGYFSALAFKKYSPQTEVVLIESDKIPIIGVGEATTRAIIVFLHKVLGFEVSEFFREVQPTYKLGIRFEWGSNSDGYFNYPFERNESYTAHNLCGNSNLGSLSSVLMSAGKSFITSSDDQYMGYGALINGSNYAYHLDNATFTTYLKKKARERGVSIVNTTIQDVRTTADGDIDVLLDANGDTHQFDFYVDCSGFRSILVGQALNTRFVDFSDSLFTNRALVTAKSNSNNPMPYTTATTMNNGWLWNTPLRSDDHLGYVYSSDFCSDDEAYDELKSMNPEIDGAKLVKFRTGRLEKCWRGNAMAIGNSFGFVEPLESTGIQMIITGLYSLFGNLEKYNSIERARVEVNRELDESWNHLRWFITWHYCFNKKLDTEFWKKVRNDSNVSGYDSFMEYYLDRGPFKKEENFADVRLAKMLKGALFRQNGLDCILVGQGMFPTTRDNNLLSSSARLVNKVHLWQKMSDNALSHIDALKVVEQNPDLLKIDEL